MSITEERRITQSLEDNATYIKITQGQIVEFEKVLNNHPVEVTKIISTMNRSIRRVERENKRMVKRLKEVVEERHNR